MVAQRNEHSSIHARLAFINITVPIDPEAIERFLNQPVPLLPDFKGASPEKLARLIYDSTGLPFKEQTTSRPHQLEGVAFALYKRRALLYYYMRLGKTKIALDWALHLRRAGLAAGKGLVIAHAPIGAEVWKTQAARHSSLNLRVIQSGEAAQDALVDALESDCDLVVIPHSTLQVLFTEKRLSRKQVPKLYPDLPGLGMAAAFFSHAIIDEIDLCSNPLSLRFSICDAILANCKQRLGLTGTPIGRDPFAVWAQAFLIDQGATLGNNYFFFHPAFGKQKRSYFAPSGSEVVFDKDKLPILQRKLNSISLTYGKNEVKSAEVFAGVVELHMAGAQRKAYNEVVDRLVHLDASRVVEIQSTFHRLRQVASGYLPFSDEEGDLRVLHFDDSIKLAWLAEFLESAPDLQGVFFHEYTHSGELICQQMKTAKRKYAWLHGTLTPSQSDAALRAFQQGEVQFLVANTRKGGISIDLPQADYLCFFESPVSPRLREQAAARPMARGDRPLMLDDLVCAPVEQKILGFLEEGRDLYEALFQQGRKLAESLRA